MELPWAIQQHHDDVKIILSTWDIFRGELSIPFYARNCVNSKKNVRKCDNHFETGVCQRLDNIYLDYSL